MKRITKEKNASTTQRRTQQNKLKMDKPEVDKTKLKLEQFKTKPKKILKHDNNTSVIDKTQDTEINKETLSKELPFTKVNSTKEEEKANLDLPLANVRKSKMKVEKTDNETSIKKAKIKEEIMDSNDVKDVEEELRVKTENLNEGNLEEKKVMKRPHSDVEYDEDKFKIEKVVDIKIKAEFIDELVTSTETKDTKFPVNWDVVLNNLRQMRKNNNAPVDSMGCDQCMDDNANPKDQRYQALLSLMLSSQTRDQVTHAAMQRLLEHGCTMENILNTSDQKLGELIYPVGFWKSKVKYIKKSTEMIRDQFGGDIPKTVKDLCKLNGVGPKMAHLCMKTAWGEVTGIGVDTHVHRISNRMGWVKSKNPEGTRTQLEGWLPKEIWSEVNHLLVGFGQQVCLPIKPSCSICLNCEICPFARKLKVKSDIKLEKGKLKEEFDV